jgi:hypothetical protein
MSKSYRKEVLKRLQQELDATTDTKEIIRISNAIAKLTPTPKQRRTRKASGAPKTVSRFTEPTGTTVDQLSEGARIVHHLVLLAEQKCKGRDGWLALTRAEKDTILAEVRATLSDGERKVLEAYEADEAQATVRAERLGDLKGC